MFWIIVTTGHGDQEIAVTAKKKGAYDYLVKDNDLNYLKVLPAVVKKAIKYSNAKMIDITIFQKKNGIALTISDDGKGIKDTSSRKGGLGLRTMKYRAGIISGRNSIFNKVKMAEQL